MVTHEAAASEAAKNYNEAPFWPCTELCLEDIDGPCPPGTNHAHPSDRFRSVWYDYKDLAADIQFTQPHIYLSFGPAFQPTGRWKRHMARFDTTEKRADYWWTRIQAAKRRCERANQSVKELNYLGYEVTLKGVKQ